MTHEPDSIARKAVHIFWWMTTHLIWWRVVGELVVGFVGPFDGDVAEKKRRRQHGFRDLCRVVGHPKILAGGFNTGAQRTLIEILEHGSAHEGTLAIEIEAIEQTRISSAPSVST